MSTSAMTFTERYRAISARDTRFDGQFVTAVRTTGIYCRPSCPARTPKPSNVAFFPTSAAAHEAGYRACKRCLPEAAPGSPEWNLRGDIAARAMRLISDGVVEREGVAGLAARLGYSSRQLSRTLTAELGAGPLALARAHRAQNARMLLVGTDLPAADVAFSAGFASVRQFNDTVREVFGMPPLALRALRTRRTGSGPGPASGPLAGAGARVPGLMSGPVDLVLAHRVPLDTSGLFAWMGARAVPGVEESGPRSYARTLMLPGGAGWFEVRHADGGLHLRARPARLADLPMLIERVRRLFDLDADPVAVDTALSCDPLLAPAVAAVPGIRVPGTVDPHELLMRAMIGQQVSVASARTALARLADALGERMTMAPVDASRDPRRPVGAPVGAPDGAAAGDRDAVLFPTMTAIAEHGAEVLRGPASRIRAIVGAATALASGELALTAGEDSRQLRAALLQLPGVGPWTADYVRMRVTGDPDVLLPGDLAARAGAAALGIPAQPRALEQWAARAAPWRSYLTAHLWRAAADARAASAHNSGRSARPMASNRKISGRRKDETADLPELRTNARREDPS
jgi:AraC family transcriptional regulator of adaptative response / DNA-3-methyladenine glycosylase II